MTDETTTETPVDETLTDEATDTPEAPQPVTLTITDGTTTRELRVAAEVAQAIIEYDAPAVVYLAGPGEGDEDAAVDQFALARQHTLNAVHELQNAQLRHPALSARGETFAHAWQVAFQATALVYNMLTQAGMMERQQMAQMRAMAEASATTEADAKVADLRAQVRD